MTVSLSMRAAWQQVADRHSPITAMGIKGEYEFCECCDENYPCPDRVTALAQINALNEAEQGEDLYRRVGGYGIGPELGSSA